MCILSELILIFFKAGWKEKGKGRRKEARAKFSLTTSSVQPLGAGGCITVNAAVVISECSVPPGTANTKVCGRLIAL